MFKRNLWKIALTTLICAWAVSSILPLKDTEFNDYIVTQVGDRSTEFNALMRQAQERVEAGQAASVFVALKQIGKEQRIDLSQYFPQVRLESSLHNIEKRNAILLDYLLKESKGKLQLGLDLKGGVSFMLEVADDGVAGDVSEYEREENLSKAIEIIDERVNQFGVAEPIIRPVGTNRIEVQLPSVSTKDNPEVVDQVKKPARLDFRRVHPYLSPLNNPETPPGYEVLVEEREGRDGAMREVPYYVKRLPEMTGESIDVAFATTDEFGRFKINLRFTDEGAERFADVTGEIAQERQGGGQLAIVLDGKLYSAPSVSQRINGGSAEITGSFTQREAIDLANVLNNPLDVELIVREQNEVGPSLATDAINSGIKASQIAVVLVEIGRAHV